MNMRELVWFPNGLYNTDAIYIGIKREIITIHVM